MQKPYCEIATGFLCNLLIKRWLHFTQGYKLFTRGMSWKGVSDEYELDGTVVGAEDVVQDVGGDDVVLKVI